MKTISILTFLVIWISGISAQEKLIVAKNDSITCTSHDTIVQTIVQESAKFQNGDLVTFKKYVVKNLHYPPEEMMKRHQGKSFVRFIVDWDGQVKNVAIYKSSGFKKLDEEAIRVVRQSPRWIPAKNNAICVPQQFIMPVAFINMGIIN